MKAAAFPALYRSLAAMHRAGIPWAVALDRVAENEPELASVRRALERGSSLAAAFAPLADPLDVALLRAGEESGSLEAALQAMADAHEATQRRRAERRTALTYPIVLAHVAAGLMALPDLFAGEPGAALGWVAAVLIPTWAFLGILRHLDRQERTPPGEGDPPVPTLRRFFGRSRIEEADARALQALGLLHDAGLPMEEALQLSVRAGWGGRAAVDMTEARHRVQRGQDLAGAWHHIPPDLAGRLADGEHAGSLGSAARRVADDLGFGVRMRRQRAASLLPILAMLGVGGLVAWRLFSFYGRYLDLGRF